MKKFISIITVLIISLFLSISVLQAAEPGEPPTGPQGGEEPIGGGAPIGGGSPDTYRNGSCLWWPKAISNEERRPGRIISFF